MGKRGLIWSIVLNHGTIFIVSARVTSWAAKERCSLIRLGNDIVICSEYAHWHFRGSPAPAMHWHRRHSLVTSGHCPMLLKASLCMKCHYQWHWWQNTLDLATEWGRRCLLETGLRLTPRHLPQNLRVFNNHRSDLAHHIYISNTYDIEQSIMP